ncbi:penicillin-binding transpeptidase domain-containing protein [Bdellovibrionota bacterium FG-1]
MSRFIGAVAQAPRALKWGASFIVAGVFLGSGLFAIHAKTHLPSPFLGPAFGNVFGPKQSVVTKENLSQALGETKALFEFPSDLEISINEKEKFHAIIQYSFDAKLQESMEQLFKSYSPDYGAFVAMDAVTGRVLAMVSYSRDPKIKENLALRATFPSASVFKVVTAAAAIQEQKLNPNSIIQFTGANHTLYRSNIMKNRVNRWSRYSTLKEAFAKSINTVFGRIGAYQVGTEKLQNYASRFGFNRAIASDFPMQQGHAHIANDADAWDLAQTASGYTRENTMSPMQGALIAAAVANDGVMMEPFVVQSVYSPEGGSLYTSEPKVASVVVKPETASEIRALMTETVTHGTSRKSFRGFFKGPFKELSVGGKTGSLTGMDPPGKYDWFVGYADGGPHRIAVAALTIHKKQWRVKSSYLARKAMEQYFFTHPVHANSVADNR